MKKRTVPKKILVFLAHPDDADFGCAATVAKLAKEGNEIIYVVISDGNKGIHKLKLDEKKISKIRKREQEMAAKAVGVKKVIFMNEKDGELENKKALRKKIVRIIRQRKPDIVLSIDPANFNFDSFHRCHRDHRQAGEAVFDSIYPAAGSYAFFPELKIRPHTIKEAWFYFTPDPNFWIDVSGTLDRKISALLCHRSQIKDSKEIKKMVEDWARKAGKKKRMKYAEAFRKLNLS